MIRDNYVTNSEHTEMVRLYQAGHTHKQIAAAVHRAEGTVASHLHRLNCYRRADALTLASQNHPLIKAQVMRREARKVERDAKIARVRELRATGMSWADVGRELGMTFSAIRNLSSRYGLSEAKISTRTQWEARLPEILRLRESGWTGGDIARHFEARKSTYEYWLSLLGVTNTRARPERIKPELEVRPKKLRPCMGCRHEFPSEGAHHRFCQRCRTSDAWYGGQEPSFAVSGVRV